jgi:hypothetical protein
MAARVDAWRHQTGTMHDPDRLRVLPVAVNLMDPTHLAAIAAYVEDLAPLLVVVDTLARCMIGADENSSRDMSTAVAALDRLRIASAGACVLVVHHSGKNIEAGARGHTALLGAADTMLKLGQTDRILTIEQEKQKHHEPGNRQSYRLVSVAGSVALDPYRGGGLDDDLTGKNVETLAALAAIETPEGVPFSLWVEAAIAAGGSKPTTARTRAKALVVGLIEVTEHGTAKSPRYRLTDAGRSQLLGDTETPSEQD